MADTTSPSGPMRLSSGGRITIKASSSAARQEPTDEQIERVARALCWQLDAITTADVKRWVDVVRGVSRPAPRSRR